MKRSAEDVLTKEKPEKIAKIDVSKLRPFLPKTIGQRPAMKVNKQEPSSTDVKKPQAKKVSTIAALIQAGYLPLSQDMIKKSELTHSRKSAFLQPATIRMLSEFLKKDDLDSFMKVISSYPQELQRHLCGLNVFLPNPPPAVAAKLGLVDIIDHFHKIGVSLVTSAVHENSLAHLAAAN